MIATVTLYEAKTHLSSLIDRAAAGEEIIVAKRGRPLARIAPLRGAAGRRPGRGKGKIKLRGNFDAPLPKATLEAFLGGAV